LARLDDRLGLGERQVEEHQEVAAGRGGHVRRLLARDLQVEDLEAGDGQLLAPLEDLEVVGGEAADRLAVLGQDLDRHLDDDHVGGFGELRGGRQRERQAGGQSQHRSPDPPRSHDIPHGESPFFPASGAPGRPHRGVGWSPHSIFPPRKRKGPEDPEP
jgi:hypothetical protein